MMNPPPKLFEMGWSISLIPSCSTARRGYNEDMNSTELTYGKLGKYSAHAGFRVNGSDVRFWVTKKQAIVAAKAIGWPVLSVEKVHTRFQIGWAIVAPGLGALSRDSFAALFRDASNDKAAS